MILVVYLCTWGSFVLFLHMMWSNRPSSFFYVRIHLLHTSYYSGCPAHRWIALMHVRRSAGSPRPCILSVFPSLGLDELRGSVLRFTSSFLCLVLSAVGPLRWGFRVCCYTFPFKNVFAFSKIILFINISIFCLVRHGSHTFFSSLDMGFPLVSWVHRVQHK